MGLELIQDHVFDREFRQWISFPVIRKCEQEIKIMFDSKEAFEDTFGDGVEMRLSYGLWVETTMAKVWIEKYCQNEDILIGLLPALFKTSNNMRCSLLVDIGERENVEEISQGQGDVI